MNDTKHIWRVFLLVIAGIAVFMIGRMLFIPKTFGQFGHYRAGNLSEQEAFPVKHQGPQACGSCHSDELEIWKAAGHKTITCENCHAPYDSHIKDDEKVADMEINRTSTSCLRCHQALSARPGSFPQIDPVEHLSESGLALSDTVCFVCHGPHDPAPRVPGDSLGTKE